MSINWNTVYNDLVLALHLATGITEVAGAVATGGAAVTVANTANATAVGTLITQVVQASVPSLSTANVTANPQLQTLVNALPIVAQGIVATKNAQASQQSNAPQKAANENS